MDSFNGYKEEAANMAAQGIYDIQQYLEVARRYDGVNGLTMADLVPVANAFASGGAKIAGVSRSGTRSQKQEKRRTGQKRLLLKTGIARKQNKPL